jgi:hypothetical protein
MADYESPEARVKAADKRFQEQQMANLRALVEAIRKAVPRVSQRGTDALIEAAVQFSNAEMARWGDREAEWDMAYGQDAI